MNYTMTQSTVFPLVEVTLQKGEEIKIESGAMVYHDGNVKLEGKMNSNGAGGLGGALKALGRSMTSGESFFITSATGLNADSKIGLAPGAPGMIRELQIGAQQWRLNDGAFFACDTGVEYTMQRQKLSGAIFGKTGGLFVMETKGLGKMLISAYGDILELNLDGTKPFVVDNMHVVAWSTSLDYNIKAASGMFGFTTGEGLVNEFHGSGTILIQTRNVQSLGGMVAPYVVSGS